MNTFEIKKNLAQKKKYSKFTLLHSISVRVLIRLKIKDIFLSKSEWKKQHYLSKKQRKTLNKVNIIFKAFTFIFLSSNMNLLRDIEKILFKNIIELHFTWNKYWNSSKYWSNDIIKLRHQSSWGKIFENFKNGLSFKLFGLKTYWKKIDYKNILKENKNVIHNWEK